jgi:hypothetical protein
MGQKTEPEQKRNHALAIHARLRQVRQDRRLRNRASHHAVGNT